MKEVRASRMLNRCLGEQIDQRTTLVRHREGPFRGRVNHFIERKAKSMGNRRVEIRDPHAIFHRVGTRLVCHTVGLASPNAAPRKHPAEGLGKVIDR